MASGNSLDFSNKKDNLAVPTKIDEDFDRDEEQDDSMYSPRVNTLGDI